MRLRSFVLFTLCLASTALAQQKVVVLEFDGDKHEKLRQQIEVALKKAGAVDLYPIEKWKKVAARKKLKGANAMTPTGVAKAGHAAGIDAAVEGAVASDFFVRILDNSGNELWKKTLPIKGGLISAEHAKKLAKAIAAAASTVQPTKAAPEEADSSEGGDEKSSDETPTVAVETEKPKVTSERDRESDRPTRSSDEDSSTAANMPQIDLSEDARSSSAESHTSTDSDVERDVDLEAETRHRKSKYGPRLVSVTLTGTTTWRAYCSRPGVSSCAAYDSMDPTQRPKGDTVNFTPQVPYAGFFLGVEAFPLANFDNAAKGLGFVGSYSLGFSLTNVTIQTPSGQSEPKQVVSVDTGITAMGAYRFFFAMNNGTAWIGGRAGLMIRNFEVDPNAQVPLPGSHRQYPALGLDFGLPLYQRIVRFEAGGSYFFNPHAGPDEIAGYGSASDPTGGAVGHGFSVEGGLAGDFWGPLGYSLKFRMTNYGDQFYGAGQKWTDGGTDQEAYSGIFWGMSASF